MNQELERKYKLIDNLVFRSKHNLKIRGKYKSLGERVLYNTYRPLLEFFSKEDLRDYIKWAKTNSLVYTSKKKSMYFTYRGFSIQALEYKPIQKHGLMVYLEDGGTTPKQNILHIVIGIKWEHRSNYFVSEYVGKPTTNKQLKITIDNLIKKHNLCPYNLKEKAKSIVYYK